MSAADLSVANVTVRLGGRAVVESVSLDLPGGSLVAIVGPNGAGKTSLLRGIVGLLRYEGRVALGGVDLASLDGRERARRIAYLPQGHEAHWPLPARDIVALGRFPHGAADPSRLSASDQDAVAEAMRLTHSQEFADRSITTLSGGERARVALARVFAGGASLILADEPTAALDPRHQLDVMRALKGRADAGSLVIAVTHDLGLAARFASNIVVLEAGRVAASGPPATALAPDVLWRVFAIEAFTAEHLGQPVVVPWG